MIYGTVMLLNSEFEGALQALTTAMECEKKLIVPLTDFERASMLSRLADAEYSNHSRDEALDFCFLAAEVFSSGRLFDPAGEDEPELAEQWTLHHYQEAMDLCLRLAERFKDLKAYEEELEVLQDGISMTVDCQDVKGVLRLQLAKAYQLVSAGYLHLGKLSKTEEAGQMAVKLYKENPAKVPHIEVSRCLFNIGVAKLRVDLTHLVTRLPRRS